MTFAELLHHDPPLSKLGAYLPFTSWRLLPGHAPETASTPSAGSQSPWVDLRFEMYAQHDSFVC